MPPKAIYIHGPSCSGKSQVVANIFYPLEDIKITSSIDLSEKGSHRKLINAIESHKKYINLENFNPQKDSEIDFIIDTCLESEVVLIITSRESPPDWLKNKIFELHTSS